MESPATVITKTISKSNEKLKKKYKEDLEFREQYKEKQRLRYRKKKEEFYLEHHGNLEGFKPVSTRKHSNHLQDTSTQTPKETNC